MHGRSLQRRSNQHIYHRLLIARCKVFYSILSAFSRLEELAQGSFEATVTETHFPVFQMCARKANCCGISLLRQSVDDATTRVTETEHLGRFIERLASRILTCYAHG